MPEEKKTVIDKIWGLFASVKFAIVIFSLISLTAIIGTILEQRAEPARNIKILAKLFGESVAPSLYSTLEKLGFMDMYHSWWFIAFLILFSANIIICSIDRLPRIWKLIREPLKPMAAEHFETAPIKREVLLKGKPDKVKEIVIERNKDNQGFIMRNQKRIEVSSFTPIKETIQDSVFTLPI